MIWLGHTTSNESARSRLCWFWGELVEQQKLYTAGFTTHHL